MSGGCGVNGYSDTYRLGPRVGRLDEALGDCAPDIVGGHVGVRPGYRKEWRVPPDHRRRLFVPLNEVVQASEKENIQRDQARHRPRHSRFGGVRPPVLAHRVPLATSFGRRDDIDLLLSPSEDRRGTQDSGTHRTHADLGFPRGAVHLIPKPLDVIERVDDDDAVVS